MCFYGEVSTDELISGDALASLVGLTAGTSHNSNEPWLKFILDGKELYYAKKSYRYNVSWTELNDRNIVSGDRTISIKGKQYKIRLISGYKDNPSSIPSPYIGFDSSYTEGSEWNRLLYRITSSDFHINDSFSTVPGAPGDVWKYSIEELGHVLSDGCYIWTLETSSVNLNAAARRGTENSITAQSMVNKTYQHNAYGWKPMLELIQE